MTERVRKIAEGAALMTETQVEEIFVAALSSMLNNHYLADLQCANLQVIGPIEWTEDELAFARQVNQGYPAGTAQAILGGYGLPAELAQEPLLGMNFPSADEGKVQTGSTDVGDLSWRSPVSLLSTACWSPAAVRALLGGGGDSAAPRSRTRACCMPPRSWPYWLWTCTPTRSTCARCARSSRSRTRGHPY